MDEVPKPGAASSSVQQPGSATGGPGDIGYRVRRAREARRLTRAEVSSRARVDEGYLAYLEESAAHPSVETLSKLARAIGTTLEDLMGVTSGVRPGPYGPAAGNVAAVLTAERCWELVGARGVARVVVPTRTPGGEPSLRVLDYATAGRALVVSASSSSGVVAAARQEARLLVEVDALDPVRPSGWSVVLSGPARVLADDEPTAGAYPWPRAAGSLLVAMTPTWLSGRRLVVDGAHR